MMCIIITHGDAASMSRLLMVLSCASVYVDTQQWEKRVEEGQKEFDHISKILKKEVKRFEVGLTVITDDSITM